MRYAILIAALTVSACGHAQSGPVTFSSTTSGTVTSVSATFAEPERPPGACTHPVNGYKDWKRSAIWNCDMSAKHWVIDIAASAKWQREIKEDEAKAIAKEARRAMLAKEIISRVLTQDEMSEAMEYAENLFGGGWIISSNPSVEQFASDYYRQKRWADALLGQFKMRAIEADRHHSENPACIADDEPLRFVPCASGPPAGSESLQLFDKAPTKCAEFYRRHPGSAVGCSERPLSFIHGSPALIPPDTPIPDLIIPPTQENK